MQKPQKNWAFYTLLKTQRVFYTFRTFTPFTKFLIQKTDPKRNQSPKRKKSLVSQTQTKNPTFFGFRRLKVTQKVLKVNQSTIKQPTLLKSGRRSIDAI